MRTLKTSILQKATLLLLVALTAVLIACPQRTKIGDLTSNPGRYAGKEVAIAGTVTSGFGVLGSGAFEVEDNTGRIWVISQNYGTPSSGAKVGLVGHVTQGVNVGGRSFAVALRLTQRPKF
jgi:hypothetical protein